MNATPQKKSGNCVFVNSLGISLLYVATIHMVVNTHVSVLMICPIADEGSLQLTGASI